MRTLIVQAITAFYASATVSDAFVTCTSFTLKATPSRGSIMASNSKSDLATTMVTQRTGATTRRYFLESTATAAAGVLGCSLLLPAPTFAAAKVDREGERNRYCTCSVRRLFPSHVQSVSIHVFLTYTDGISRPVSCSTEAQQ